MLCLIVIAIEYEVLNLLSEWEEADEWEYESNDKCCVELIVVNSFYRVEIESEHSGDERSSVVECLESEEHPAYHCQDESDYHTW